MIDDSILNLIIKEERRFFLCDAERNVWPLDDLMKVSITVDAQGILDIKPDTEKK